MPWPAFFKQAATPSARVLSAPASTTSPSAVSSLGRMRPRNSCTSCPRTCAWPPSRAARHSSPQVSKARSRISSAMEKSKTGRSACAVWATKGAYSLPSSSAKVCTHSRAFCRSSMAEVLMTITLTLPSLSGINAKFTSSSSPKASRVFASSSFGARANFSRMPGRMWGTKGRKSAFMVQQMRCAACSIYSLTGSLAGRSGTCAAWVMACMMPSASARKPAGPAAFARRDTHSKALPSRDRSSVLCRTAEMSCLSTGISCP
mmetsp:Transcript_26497/g.83046  ORF Transcript_26497/g.83046 Transcript_26497/m.83046 type:complete len:261 (-) Transcript_26497:526-1308(-)